MTSPILVTGSHRSGTTWVGKTLAQDPNLVYIQEPFNVNYPQPLAGFEPDYWYKYVHDSDKAIIRSALQRVFELKYPLRVNLQKSASLTEKRHAVAETVRFTVRRWRGLTPLMKDPLALLSAPWIAKTFGVAVLVMIRHPAAFSGSLKKKDWAFPFDDLLSQTVLMEEKLSGYRSEIKHFVRHEQDIVDQAALLWKILYDIVSDYREHHPDWIFVRHEDLARSPVEEFGKLFDSLELSYSDEIRNYVAYHSGKKASHPPQNVEGNNLVRNSQSVVKNWKQRLTKDEIERVRKRTHPVASQFYDDADW